VRTICAHCLSGPATPLLLRTPAMTEVETTNEMEFVKL
jgi:hypothetical protein